MKIGVIGKGGSGKTTVSGVLARSLARQGWEVVAIDCDSNPNLGISLGLGLDQIAAECGELGQQGRVARLRNRDDQYEGRHSDGDSQRRERGSQRA